MIILAIDPGFERLGIAILKKEKNKTPNKKEELIYSECFHTSKKDIFADRLLNIQNHLKKIIKKYKPDCIAIETLYFSSNIKTAMQVSEARGVIIVTARSFNLSIFEYNPMQIKVATAGHGKADKKQIMYMVKKLISIPENIKSDDELDAIAIGLTAIAYEKW